MWNFRRNGNRIRSQLVALAKINAFTSYQYKAKKKTKRKKENNHRKKLKKKKKKKKLVM